MPTNKTEERVTRVIDGDTFETAKGPVRLANVDAPELHNRGGSEAKRDLEGIIGGKDVSIEVVAHDSYGRPVAEVKIGSWSINKAMKSKL